jgi:hypothetical protein
MTSKPSKAISEDISRSLLAVLYPRALRHTFLWLTRIEAAIIFGWGL